jgi:hypothetical protein
MDLPRTDAPAEHADDEAAKLLRHVTPGLLTRVLKEIDGRDIGSGSPVSSSQKRPKGERKNAVP